MREDVQTKLRTEFGTESLFIPKKFTSLLQPIDVVINGPFKTAVRNEWKDWFRDGEQKFSPSGNRKPPSYQSIVDMISRSLSVITPEIVRKSFQSCGVAEKGGSIDFDQLNSRLQGILRPELPVSLSENESESDFDGSETDGNDIRSTSSVEY